MTGLLFAIDANRINSRQKLPNMNRLEKWEKEGIIFIEMPETAHREARQGGDLTRRLKASPLESDTACSGAAQWLSR
jgi:hypothetical protein